jgi:L-amino acid N-acyltransferase YncA
MSMIDVRDRLEAGMPSIQAIYGRPVRTGTASFEIQPPPVRS